MNIIIAGDGEVGFHLAKMLHDEHHDITIVDPHEELLKMLESHTDILTITGDSTSVTVLNKAKVNKADLLISVLHDETTNLVTCALGKKLGAERTIARINNTEYLAPSTRDMFKQIGVDELVCPESIAADEIIALLKQTAATEIYNFSHGRLSLFLIKLDENALVLNKTLNEVAIEYPQLAFRAVAIHRNSQTIIPRGDDMFLENDLAYVITKPDGIHTLIKLGGKQHIEIKDIMIVGGGRIGRKTAQRLEKNLNIKMVELDKSRSQSLANDLERTLVINGDARDIELLKEEGITDTDAFIAVTDNSETNILTCLHATKLGVRRTIALVENLDYIDISQNIGINTIINKKLISASYIARFTMNAEVTSIKCLSGIDAEVLEFVAKPGSDVTRKPINRLRIPEGAIIGGIVRGKASFIAIGDFQILENDHVVVFALPKAIHKVDRLFN
ncbi:MAG TPA: Trk system potassium transporter TrkA [Bacteroidales bacterium]|nr:Trk system potassium transporter TrkA [Bacteroidales bacterium]HPE55641.1 Trk system potassium transporter TrkA [Bacteroidales bacterium]HRX96216.1 Trk system potassium transporter TrkA [Bacteroidales bacterium]